MCLACHLSGKRLSREVGPGRASGRLLDGRTDPDEPILAGAERVALAGDDLSQRWQKKSYAGRRRSWDSSCECPRVFPRAQALVLPLTALATGAFLRRPSVTGLALSPVTGTPAALHRGSLPSGQRPLGPKTDELRMGRCVCWGLRFHVTVLEWGGQLARGPPSTLCPPIHHLAAHPSAAATLCLWRRTLYSAPRYRALAGRIQSRLSSTGPCCSRHLACIRPGAWCRAHRASGRHSV